jgi:hypothetical protein
MAEEAPRRGDAIGLRLCRPVVHVLALLAPAVPIGVTTGLQIARGWRPTSDDAAIAWRTWDVFSAHAPLVGAFNDATQIASQPVFDPGPLEYYLLAVPDRIDPVHGILWGTALLCALLVALAVEAVWRAGGPVGAVVVAAGAIVLSATQTVGMINLPWNPNIGVFAFSATLVISAVAGTGRLRWWPVAVVAGSLAAQCDLVFGLGSLGCLAVGLGLGAARHLRRPEAGAGSGGAGEATAATATGAAKGGGAGEAPTPAGGREWLPVLRPLGVGVALGVLTMLAPIVQEAANAPGNLTVLVHNLRHQGAGLGLSFGLRGIAQVAGIPPAWARPVPPLSGTNWYLQFLHALFGGSPTAGVVILAAAGLVTAGAFVTRRMGLAALAGAAALSGIATAWTFGGISVHQGAIVTYTDIALWPVGMALDAAFLWGAFELVAAGVRHLHPRRHALAQPAHVAAALVGAVATFAPLLVWAITSLAPATSSDLAVIGGWRVARAVVPLAQAIEHQHPDEPVLVEPSVHLFPTGLPTWALTEGLAYELKISGIDARLMQPMQPQLGGDAASSSPEITYLVEPIPGGGWRVVRVAKPQPTSLIGVVLSRPRERPARRVGAGF